MTTIQLNCFLEVADTLNFARAAEHLYITQPAVTQQINSLEKELNVKLLKRTTRTVQLTPEGSLFLGDAKRILHIIGYAKKRFECYNNCERLFFSVGCHSQREFDLLTNILSKMLAVYPTLSPIFHTVPFKYLFQLLKEEAVDVIFSFREKVTKKGYGTYKELMRINPIVIMPKTFHLVQKKNISAKDIVKEKLILYNRQNAPECFNEIQDEFIKGKSMSDIYLCETYENCITLVKSGFGITVLPDLAISRDCALEYIPLSGLGDMSYGVYYNNTKGKPVLKHFLKLCQEHFNNKSKS